MLITEQTVTAAPDRTPFVALGLAIAAPILAAGLGAIAGVVITSQADPFAASGTWVSILFLVLQLLVIVALVTASSALARRFLVGRPTTLRWAAWVALGFNALTVVTSLLPIVIGLASLITGGALA